MLAYRGSRCLPRVKGSIDADFHDRKRESTVSYHEHSDMQYGGNIKDSAPAAFQAYSNLGTAALRGEDNPIDAKHATLVALAVALTTQCVYCIETHSKEAANVGATEQEVAQTTMIVAAVRAGGGVGHGLLATKFYKEAKGDSAS